MVGQPSIGSLAARLGLTFQLIGQIFLTPFVAFSLTYLIVFGASTGQLMLSVELDMLPYIGLTSLIYGMTALVLALALGGFIPLTVVDRGGWRLALGLTRNSRSGAHRLASRRRYANSSHGRLALLVHDRCAEGHPLWTIRGSLILLAIPFQVALATIPLIAVLVFPEGVVAQNRQLELALLLYAVCLFASIRLFPGFARRYIALANIARKLLGNTLRVSWAFPIFLLWSMGQISSYIVQRVFGSDMSLNFQIEKQIFETMISAQSIPETSFLNLLTALAVMPMAAFTTLAVLGGGATTPPLWMRPTEAADDDPLTERLDNLASTVDRLQEEQQRPQEHAEYAHHPAIVQPLAPTMIVAQVPQHHEPRPSLVDGLDVDGMLSEPHTPPNPLSEPSTSSHADASESSHRDPVIRGFDSNPDP